LEYIIALRARGGKFNNTMRVEFDISDPNIIHKFEKTNLVTDVHNRDWYKCKYCGLVGTRKGLSPIVSASGPRDKVLNCTKERRQEIKEFKDKINNNSESTVNGFKLSKTRVKIIRCECNNSVAGNLTPNSIHNVIINEGQKELKSRFQGEWVLGADNKTPVLLLTNEFSYVRED